MFHKSQQAKYRDIYTVLRTHLQAKHVRGCLIVGSGPLV